MTTTTKPELSPKDARTNAALCHLPADNVWWGDYGVSISQTTIRFSEQKLGESPVGSVTLPRWIFEMFARWYETGETPGQQRKRGAK